MRRQSRARHAESHENHERWIVSYADFVTLLFAFFVVMYSISSVNEGKYRVLSDSLEHAFNDSPLRSLNPIQVGEVVRSLSPFKAGDSSSNNADFRANEDDTLAGNRTETKLIDMDALTERLQQALLDLPEKNRVKVRQGTDWVEIEMKNSVLFASGAAELQPAALPILTNVAQILREFDNSIQVEGHTDSNPIATGKYPSNWELSAARAASVVRQLEQLAITPDRLAASGYGEQRPIDDNALEEGRANNRRVVIIVANGVDQRRAADQRRLQQTRAERRRQQLPELAPLQDFALPPREGFDS